MAYVFVVRGKMTYSLEHLWLFFFDRTLWLLFCHRNCCIWVYSDLLMPQFLWNIQMSNVLAMNLGMANFTVMDRPSTTYSSATQIHCKFRIYSCVLDQFTLLHIFCNISGEIFCAYVRNIFKTNVTFGYHWRRRHCHCANKQR